MTDTEETPNEDAPTDNATDETPDEAPTDDAEATETGDEDGKAGREAAKYRRQLRDAQSSLEESQARLTGAQTELLGHVVSKLRAKASMQLRPEAVRELTDTTGFFNDDGTTDEKAIKAALEALFEERPYLFQKNLEGTFIIPNEGKTPERFNAPTGWESAFRD